MAARGTGNRVTNRDVGETLSTETEAESEGEAGAEVPVLHVIWPDILA